MSPSATAPSIASHNACIATSPSECATSPAHGRIRTPPSITWSPSVNACTSSPCPIRCPLTYSRVPPGCCRMNSASARSSALVILILVDAPATSNGCSPAVPWPRASSVGSAPRGQSSLQMLYQRAQRKQLRRLGSPLFRTGQPCSIWPSIISLLQRIADRAGQDGARHHFARPWSSSGPDQSAFKAWPGRIMHHHPCHSPGPVAGYSVNPFSTDLSAAAARHGLHPG